MTVEIEAKKEVSQLSGAPVLIEDVLPLLTPWQLAAALVILFHHRHGYYPAASEVMEMVKQQLGLEMSLSTARRALRRVVSGRCARASKP